MDIEHGLPRRRRPRASLTRRQHEVLAAIASGKTNRQIAERLGISLDGVKYHVREILGLLGVDTREEAAEWWRQNQGLPARMAIATDFGRSLMRAKLALLGSGAAAAAALGVVAVLMLIRSDGAEEGSLGPGVWTALAEPVGDVVCAPPNDAICTSDAQRLVVLDEHGEQVRALGHVGKWNVLRWSPDGQALAAVEEVTADGLTKGRLHIFDLATGTSVTHALESPYGPVTWSPDGERLLAYDSRGPAVFNRSAAPLGVLEGDRATWATDGSYRLAVDDEDEVRIVNERGQILASSSMRVFPVPEDEFLRGMSAVEFDGSQLTVRLRFTQLSPRGGDRVVRGTIEPAGIAWSEPEPADPFGIPPGCDLEHSRAIWEPIRLRLALNGRAVYLTSAGCWSGPNGFVAVWLGEIPLRADGPVAMDRTGGLVGWTVNGESSSYESEALGRSKGATPVDVVFVPE